MVAIPLKAVTKKQNILMLLSVFYHSFLDVIYYFSSKGFQLSVIQN